ncbi:MAG TPA: DUF4359 domain-containing protein [Cyanophyceae cyanobacterium]
MKPLKIVTGIGGAALVVLGGWMALTNPRQEIYEQYAVKQLTTYLKNEVCEQAPGTLDNLLKRQCSILVDAGRPQIEHIISEKTQRLNFIFFSIYQTDLEIGPFLPAYHFETVAAFQKFYTYKAEKQ